MKKVILLVVLMLLVGGNNNLKIEEIASTVEAVIEEDIVYLDISLLKEKLAYDENNIMVEYPREIKFDNTYYVQMPIRTNGMFNYYENK